MDITVPYSGEKGCVSMALFARRMSHVHRSFVREILKVTEDPSIISFAGGLPNPRFFPVEAIDRASHAVMQESGAAALQYSTTEGFLPLRQYIAERYASKGTHVGPEQILITSGSQQGLDLVGKVLLDEGDTVLVERPSYLAAIQAFGLFQPAFRSLLLEDDGVSVDGLKEALSRDRPKLFYAVTNFQNPSGISWSEEKRRVAARMMNASDTAMVEDDPYGDLRYVGGSVPPLVSFMDGKSLSPQAILLGTFSKTVAPGLRLGWLCAGSQIMERIVTAKQAADLHSSIFAQRVLHRYLHDNPIDQYIARIREAYGRQCQCMIGAFDRLFPSEVKCTRPEGGMFLWVTLPEGMSSLEMFDRAIKEKVAFVPGQAFFANGGGENTMRLNYSNSDEPTIEEGMQRLAAVYRKMREGA
jgi:2-aminoadipate transaminase